MDKKIGILGGSFNPIHNAHLKLASISYTSLSLDKILFIPCFQSPFKDVSAYNIRNVQRIEMLKSALSSFNHFEIELFEILRNQVSYSIDTINYLQNKYPYSELFLIIGADQSNSFHKWKNWQEILRSVTLCIAKRNNTKILLNDEVVKYCNYHNYKNINLEFDEINISSSIIREMIKNNEVISSFVPSSVADYIETNNLYKQ